MKNQQKIAIIVMACVLLGSCTPSRLKYATTPTEYKATPTRFTVDSTESVLSPQEYGDYIIQLANDSAARVPYQLSPDGKWMLSDSCFNADKDLFLFSILERGIKYQIDLSRALPEQTQTLCGVFWAPDSRSFILLGNFIPPHPAFLLIVDVANLNSIQINKFEWGYDTSLGVKWSPHSSKIIGFTGERQIFVLNRKGALLSSFRWDENVSSLEWISESQYVTIRNNQNLWVTDIEKRVESQVYTFKNEQLILGYKPERNELLLLSEMDALEFTVFNLSEMKEKGTPKVETPKFLYSHDFIFIATTNPDISGIHARSTFWIFDWKSLKVRNLGDKIDPVIWSPILDGFLYSKNFNYDNLLLLKP